MNRTLENPFYYLENFHRVLNWIGERYDDLLVEEEREFLRVFPDLSQASRALLVRMVMRKGDLFRASKLNYTEIGSTSDAVQALVERGWVDDGPQLSLDELCALLKKQEIAQAFALPARQAALKKPDLLALLRERHSETRCFNAWCSETDDCVYRLSITPLCERLRLMFFGNLRQDWTEFVLSDLGLFVYEKVEFSPGSRGFQTRQDVDAYLELQRCRERFEQGEALEDILPAVPAQAYGNAFLESRRAKLQFRIAQELERAGELERAFEIYAACSYAEAGLRAIRVLERLGRCLEAHALADAALRQSKSEVELQQLRRMLPRLQAKIGLPKSPRQAILPAEEIMLRLPKPDTPVSVEAVVRDHLANEQAPVYYVENTLIGSLFGLLFWDVIFAAVPGAFFHPFHSGPADLHSADFYRRREALFEQAFACLASDAYRDTIRSNFSAKYGIQSPFVAWGVFDECLLDLALTCLPAQHLQRCFERILLDIQNNRTGLPDLIQFWPQEGRYRLIEVKGPGDRLQDNQIRWIDYCNRHGIPVSVCYVEWSENGA